MGAYSQVYDQIPLRIYDAAVRYKVGIPLKGPQRKTRQVLFAILLLIIAIIICIIGYCIYSAINSNFFSHVSHDLSSVSGSQFLGYLWQQTQQNQFWKNQIQFLCGLLFGVRLCILLYCAARTELYVCTEGLLLINQKQEQAILWSEVKEFYSTNSQVVCLVKMDESRFDISLAMLGSLGRPINRMILDELMKRLLPVAQAYYECGEVVVFGDLKVSKSGIFLREQQISWSDLGAIKLEKNQLSAYYVTPAAHNMKGLTKLASRASRGKWHIWQKPNVPLLKSRPNLPVFMALVTPIIAQHASYVPTELSGTTPALSLQERAERAQIKDKRRRRIAMASAIVIPVCLFGLMAGYFFYQSTEQQQQTDKDTQLMRNAIYQQARKPYYAQLPGQQCDHGKVVWQDDNTKNEYDCLHNGLLMTRKDYKYEAEEFFSFTPDDPALYGQYIPAHYRVQVNATFVSGATCVALGVHVQDSGGLQKFDICNDGSWYYYRCNSGCPEYLQIATGALANSKSAYTIAVDVSNTTLKLIVDNKVMTTIQDKTYSSTAQLELIVNGDASAEPLPRVLFSDFLYAPYP